MPSAFSLQYRDYSDPGYWMGRIEDWRKAVELHRPGQKDPSALAIGGWSTSELQLTLALFKNLIQQSVYELKKLPELAGKSIPAYLGIEKESNKNYLLKRGALLHADISLLNLETGSADSFGVQRRLIEESIKRSKKVPASGRAQGVWYLRLLSSAASDLEDMPGSGMALIQDGRYVHTDEGRHMEYGRFLLDSVTPRPSQDEMVRLWYIATSAYGLSSGRPPYIDKHLKDAVDVFPSDPLILFFAGALHETYASPRYQNAPRMPGVKYAYRSRKSELELARQFFRRAAAADPNFAQARLRLGHVSGLLGYHREAVSDLEFAVRAIKDPRMLYYASLFLGHEQAMLGRRIEARRQFEYAATLYPGAQSPLLALSQLAHSGGDIERASAAIERAFEVAAGHARGEDPRWRYDLVPDGAASALITDMRRTFGELSR
jgi:tetratricopeptide (TPR) repeat protein